MTLLSWHAEARFQPVFVRMWAVFANASLLESFGRSYDLAGPKVYTLRELVAYAGELTGHRRPIIGLGPRLSRLQAQLMELLPGKMMTRDNIDSMQVDSVSEAALPFGIAPTPIEAVAPVWLAHRTPRARYQQFRDRTRSER